MEHAIVTIAQAAPTGLLILITIAGVFCAKFLWSMDKNISAIKAYALELHNLHEKKITILELKQVEADAMIKHHDNKLEKHHEEIILLKTAKRK
jgi:hypothetical protein